MASKSWKIIVYETDESTPDFTITDSELVAAPTIGGQRAKPLEGKVESVSWKAEVGDFSGFIATELGDSDDRQHLQGRLVEAQIDTGSGFQTIWIGRWTGSSESNGPGKFSITFATEHWKALNADIFRTQDTTQLFPNYPVGLNDPWNKYPRGDTIPAEVLEVDGDHVQIIVQGGRNNLFSEKINLGARVPDSVVEFLRDDVKPRSERNTTTTPTAGNFENLRLVNEDTSTDYEIINFGGAGFTSINAILSDLLDEPARWPPIINLYWPGISPNVGDRFQISINADGSVTSEGTPLHIGGEDGIDPIQLLKDKYQAEGIRIDSNIFDTFDESTNPDGLLAHPDIPKMWFRITGPQKLGKWAEENVYKSLGLVPFINSNGEIAPKFILIPKDVDPNTLTTINASDISTDGHPTWDHLGNEAITAVRSTYNFARKIEVTGSDPQSAKFDSDTGDAIEIDEKKSLVDSEHDRLSAVGRREHVIHFSGVWDNTFARRIREQLAIEIFDRYGDGPIKGQVSGLSSLEAIEPGEFFVIDLDTFPNASEVDGRGGTRVVQNMASFLAPAGPTLEFLDVGPDSQPLSAPTLSIAKNTNEPESAIDATISGLDADATQWFLQLRVQGIWGTYAVTDVGTTTITIDNLIPGETYDARALVSAPERIRSAWSSPLQTVTLDSISAPTGIAVDEITGSTAKITWTVASSDLKVQVLLDGTLITTLFPNSNRFFLQGLSPSTMYTIAVRHIHDSGAISSEDSTTFTTLATTPVAPELTDFGYLVGGRVF